MQGTEGAVGDIGEASPPLQFGVSTGTMPNCSGELAPSVQIHRLTEREKQW